MLILKKAIKTLGISVTPKRVRMSRQFIGRGNGLEIGALHRPLSVNDKVNVSYVDRMDETALQETYAEVANCKLKKVDIIDDGEKLETVADASQDFIIANHMLEHCEDPIRTIENHIMKLKDGGILFYSIPDKRFTFDRHRKLTTFEHLVEDYTKGVEHSRKRHYQEWLTDVVHHGKKYTIIEAELQQLMTLKASIHFHCWNKRTFIDFLHQTRNLLQQSFEICAVKQNYNEIIAILRK